MALALAGLYQPKWSEEILAEAERNLARHTGAATAQRRMNQLREILPGAMVADYGEHLVGPTNDPKDRHVVAAALASEATTIVTGNLRDFHPIPKTMKAVLPDTFLYQFIDHVGTLIEVLERVRAQWPNPPTYERLLEKLGKFAPQFASEMRRAL